MTDIDRLAGTASHSVDESRRKEAIRELAALAREQQEAAELLRQGIADLEKRRQREMMALGVPEGAWEVLQEREEAILRAEAAEARVTELEAARPLLIKARFKLAEASGYIRAVNVGQAETLAAELDWLREDITAYINDARAALAADRTEDEATATLRRRAQAHGSYFPDLMADRTEEGEA